MPDLHEEMSAQRALDATRRRANPTRYLKIGLFVIWLLVSIDANTGGSVLTTKYNTLINFTLLVLSLDLLFDWYRARKDIHNDANLKD